MRLFRLGLLTGLIYFFIAVQPTPVKGPHQKARFAPIGKVRSLNPFDMRLQEVSAISFAGYYPTVPSISTNSIADFLFANGPYHLSSAVTLVNYLLYTDSMFATSFKWALYDNTGTGSCGIGQASFPGSLVANTSTSGTTMTGTGTDYYTQAAPGTSNAPGSAGDYWITWLPNGNFDYWYDNPAGAGDTPLVLAANSYAGGFPSTFPGGGSCSPRTTGVGISFNGSAPPASTPNRLTVLGVGGKQ